MGIIWTNTFWIAGVQYGRRPRAQLGGMYIPTIQVDLLLIRDFQCVDLELKGTACLGSGAVGRWRHM